MLTRRSRQGVFSTLLTATLCISPIAARGQTFTVELLNPPTNRGGARIKDIADDRTLMIQQLDSRAQPQVIEDYVQTFSTVTNSYDAPISLSFRFGLEPGGMDRRGVLAVGSVLNQATAVDITTNRVFNHHPKGQPRSFINASDGADGVGWMREAMTDKRAVLYLLGNNGSATNLHPEITRQLGPDWITSELLGLRRSTLHLVGWGARHMIPGHRAIAKLGSWVELHPSSFDESEAVSVFDTFQAGWGKDAMGLEHALVWQGNAASMRSLNPPGYGNSRCVDMDSEGIVGYGKLGTQDRATFWKRVPTHPNGFAPLDLGQFLPVGTGNSVASGITASGIIAGHYQTNGVWRPVLWHPIHLTGLTLSRTRILGGTTAKATVRISRPAPAAGVTVRVGPRFGPLLYTQVDSVTIPPGATETAFTVYSGTVSGPTPASVSATLGHEQVFATATVDTLSIWF